MIAQQIGPNCGTHGASFVEQCGMFVVFDKLPTVITQDHGRNWRRVSTRSASPTHEQVKIPVAVVVRSA